MPLPTNPKPTPRQSRQLARALALPAAVTGIRCTAAMSRSERVAVRVELVAAGSASEAPVVLDALTARMGVTLWRQVVMPAVQVYAAVRRLTCHVTEVLSLGAPTAPVTVDLPLQE